MKIIVPDSNIIFSSLRAQQSKLLYFLENERDFNFYTPNFLVVEIFKHRDRIRKKSKLTEDEFLEVLNTIIQRLRFYNEDMISTANLIHAWRLVHAILTQKTTSL
jgi:predicted nucleic acid-binding protein